MKALSSESFQGWMTPDAIAERLREEFGFLLDVAADEENHKAPLYFTEMDDGLKQPWNAPVDANGFGGVFCNPPHEDPESWLEKAYLEVLELKRCGRAVFVLPAPVGVKWFSKALTKSEVQFFEKRLPYQLPSNPEKLPEKYRDGKKRSSPGTGSCVIIIEPDGLIGVTALRSITTGEIVFDYLDQPNSLKG